MRIFCAVRHSKDPSYFYGGLWSGNFYPALRALGHEIIESQVDLLPTSRFMAIPGGFTREELEVRAQTTQQIVDEVRSALRQGPVDLFLSYFYNSHFDPAGFDTLRTLDVPSVNFYCNSIYQFELVSGIAAKADFAWHAERDARNAYLAAGANPIWVRMAADPNVYCAVQVPFRQPRAVFVGQRYADRDRWLAALIRANVPVDIYGSGWPGQTDSCSRPLEERYLGRRYPAPASVASYMQRIADEIRKNGLIAGIQRLKQQALYRHATRCIAPALQKNLKGRSSDVSLTFANYEVCLNFSNVWADGQPGAKLLAHARLRDFEAPMCRACYLTGYSDEIGESFDLGREIDTYRTTEELIDKTSYYLNRPGAAEDLRERGYRRALRDHTWVHRFEELFRKLKLREARSSQTVH